MQNNKDKPVKLSEIHTNSLKAQRDDQNHLPEFRQERSLGSRDDIFFLYKINNIITERNLLQPDQRILIAVSGGQDSICLLRLLVQLKKKWNWKLGLIHCDHRWKSSSKIQAEHVAQLAVNLQINYHEAIAIESVQQEGIARIWRYNIIQTVAISNNYTAIITGHNASDRIETLLYNLTRGSGLHGLQSIKWKRYLCFSLFIQSVFSKNADAPKVRQDPSGFPFRGPTAKRNLKYIMQAPNCKHQGSSRMDFKGSKTAEGQKACFIFQKRKQLHLIRPLLEITRTEIRHLLNVWNLPSWPDVSNKQLRIRRNRIRHRLIPYIRIHYNPNIDQTLVRWAEIVQSETLYLEQLTNYILSKFEIKKTLRASLRASEISLTELRKHPLFTPCEDRRVDFYQSAIPIDLLRSLPLAMQRRVLKQYIYLNTNRILGFQYIEQIRLSCLCKQLSSSLQNFRSRHRPLGPSNLSNQTSIRSMNTSTISFQAFSDWMGPEKKKKKKAPVGPWLFFPGGIKLLVRKNYLFLFFPKA